MIIEHYEDLEKRQIQNIAIAFGCFDILHYGHVNFFKELKKRTSFPIVIGILDDVLVRSLKGANRPINSELKRAEVVDSIRYVDYTMILSRTGDCANYEKAYRITDREKPLWEKCLFCLDVLRPSEFYYSTDFPMEDNIIHFLTDRGICHSAVPYTEGISSTQILQYPTYLQK